MNEILIHAKTLMNLKNIIVTEKSQLQNITYYMVPYTQMFRIGKSIQIESRLVVG